MHASDRQLKRILIPSELVLLRRVLERLCSEIQVKPDSDQGADMALRVFYFYERGVCDEEELFLAASGRRGRQAQRGTRAPQLASATVG